MHCDSAKGVTLAKGKHTEFGFADARRVLQHSLEHWLQFAGRTADNLQYVGGGGLLLKGFT